MCELAEIAMRVRVHVDQTVSCKSNIFGWIQCESSLEGVISCPDAHLNSLSGLSRAQWV